MFNMPFTHRIVISLLLTIIMFLVCIIAIPTKIYLVLPFAIGSFGYQLIDWLIYNRREQKFKFK